MVLGGAYPPLLPSGNVGLKWEVVDTGPVTVRAYYPMEMLGSRQDYDEGSGRVTAVVVAKTGHMARMNAISPVEFVERKRGSGSITGSATG